jgi:hypothetical protein
MQEHLVILHIHNQNIKESVLLSVDSNKLLLNIFLVTDVLKFLTAFTDNIKNVKLQMNICNAKFHFTDLYACASGKGPFL